MSSTALSVSVTRSEAVIYRSAGIQLTAVASEEHTVLLCIDCRGMSRSYHFAGLSG